MDDLKIKFELFWRRTHEKVEESMENAPDFPPDMNALNSWIDQFRKRVMERSFSKRDSSQMTMSILDWTRRFVKKFKYIDKATFVRELNLTVRWLKAFIKFQRKPFEQIILTTEDQTYKAGVWLTLLVWPKIKHIITHVYRRNDVPKYLADGKRTLVIQFDDASYSGAQYAEEVTLLYNREYPNVTHACAIVYYSKYAKEYIEQGNEGRVKLAFREDAPILETLYDSEENVPDFESSGLWNAFFGYENKTATYFFHKMADNLSVYQQILAFLPLPPKDSDTVYDVDLPENGIIQGCDFEDVRDAVGANIPRLLSVDLSRHYPCPLPPYKTVWLEFNLEKGSHLLCLLKTSS